MGARRSSLSVGISRTRRSAVTSWTHRHPVTAGVQDFAPRTSCIAWRTWRRDGRLLASYDARAAEKPYLRPGQASDPARSKHASHAWREEQPRAPLVYAKPHGAGWICVNALGHDPSAIANPGFRQLTTQAARWLTGAGPA